MSLLKYLGVCFKNSQYKPISWNLANFNDINLIISSAESNNIIYEKSFGESINCIRSDNFINYFYKLDFFYILNEDLNINGIQTLKKGCVFNIKYKDFFYEKSWNPNEGFKTKTNFNERAKDKSDSMFCEDKIFKKINHDVNIFSVFDSKVRVEYAYNYLNSFFMNLLNYFELKELISNKQINYDDFKIIKKLNEELELLVSENPYDREEDYKIIKKEKIALNMRDSLKNFNNDKL